MKAAENPWSSDKIAARHVLWAEGHATAEIGRRLGMTKNAVVGKARRFGLLARPSPIRGVIGAPRKPRPARVRGPTLAPLASLQTPAPIVPFSSPQPSPKPTPMPRRALPQPPPPLLTSMPCSWPIGEPGTKSFRYCDAPSVPGKPYCAEHCRIAYVARPKRVKSAGDERVVLTDQMVADIAARAA